MYSLRKRLHSRCTAYMVINMQPLSSMYPSKHKKSPNILAAFDQLSLLEQLKSFSKPGGFAHFFNDKLEVIAKNDANPIEVYVCSPSLHVFFPPVYRVL
jgi:hypothetical protein